MPSLTTGSLRDAPRQIGGIRTALRREQRRAERSGNRSLANQLGGRIAEANLTRAANGDSNLNSADSDIAENSFLSSIREERRGKTVELLSDAQVSSPVATDPIAQQGEPREAVADSSSPRPTDASLATVRRGAGDSQADDGQSTGSSPETPVAPDQIEATSPRTQEGVVRDDVASLQEPGSEATAAEMREYMAYLDELGDPDNTSTQFLLRRRSAR